MKRTLLLIAVVVSLLGTMAIASAVFAASPTITYVAPFEIGCGVQDIIIETLINGDDVAFNSYYRFTADAAGLRYTDFEFQGPRPDGKLLWPVNDQNTGVVNGTFPLPPDTPITMVMRITEGSLGSLLNGLVIVIDKCNGGQVISVTPLEEEASLAACPNPLPAGSMVRSVPAGAPVYYAADASTLVTWTLAPGSYWITQTSGDFAQVWQTCQGNRFWIPSSAVSQ